LEGNKLEDRIKLKDRIPSWVSSIEGHGFVGPGGILVGRYGDSLVGRPGKPVYKASANLLPYIKFGKYKTTNYTNNKSFDYPFEADGMTAPLCIVNRSTPNAVYNIKIPPASGTLSITCGKSVTCFASG
jgi:hypothetical protein